MSAQEKSWEDLRLVLAIARGQGLSGASRILGCHHATVLRRLDSLEHRSGVVLFDRAASGYQPTNSGEELARLAEVIEQDVLSAYRKLEGNDLRLSGSIRCATTDYMASTVLPTVIRQFHQQYPDIEIEVSVSSHLASLTKRDADVAIRITNHKPVTLFGTCVSQIGFGVYSHADYVGALEHELDLEDLDWIDADNSMGRDTMYRWRIDAFPGSNARVCYDSMMGRLGAVRAGLGIGFLPHYLARSIPDLVCLKSDPDTWCLGLWLLSHSDLKHMYRIKAFLGVAQQALSGMRLTS